MATMAALKSTSTFLHIGDRISLFHEPSNGYVGAEGFANVLVACDPSDGKVSDDKTRNEARRAAHRCPRSRPAPAQRGPLCPQVRDAIFVVHQMANYSVAKQLKAYLEKNGMTLQEAQGEPRCRALLQQKAKEDALNEEEFESSTGREVRYGMIVQLKPRRAGGGVAAPALGSHLGYPRGSGRSGASRACRRRPAPPVAPVAASTAPRPPLPCCWACGAGTTRRTSSSR